MKKSFSMLVTLLVTILLAANIVYAEKVEKPLDNAQVINLTKADLGDSVIIAKIKASKEVKFDLETDNLVKLKEAGVSKAVIAAMLEKASAKNTSKSSDGIKVVLPAKSGDIELKSAEGTFRRISAPFVGVRRYVEFSPKNATTRINDNQPAILVYSSNDPSKGCFFVKIYQDRKSRWIDLESPGRWGGASSNKPYGDCLMKYSVAEEKSGVWRFKPESALNPDDYGLYCLIRKAGALSYVIYEFGIDK